MQETNSAPLTRVANPAEKFQWDWYFQWLTVALLVACKPQRPLVAKTEATGVFTESH